MDNFLSMKTSAKTKPRSPVGKRIAEARKKAGLTQVDVATKLGVSQQVITFWEREAPAPRAEMLAPLAQLLNVSIDELLGLTKATKKKGPASRLEKSFADVAKLPRRKQDQVLDVVDTLLKQ